MGSGVEADAGSDPVDDSALGRPARFGLTVDRVAKGGAALGLAPDGRVAFVSGAIPGETVEVAVTTSHKKRLEATTVSVVEPSPHRVNPPCPHVDDGCGGCDWQFIAPDHQGALRAMIVTDSLRRLGGLESVDVRRAKSLRAEGYRTTVRAAVSGDRAAFRRRGSDELIIVDQCLISHPLAAELLVEGRYPGSSEVTVRVGANTGERMVMVDGPTDTVRVPDDVQVVQLGGPGTHRRQYGSGRHSHDDLHSPHIHEEINGIRFQISAQSFFQCRPDGAALLAELVHEALADTPGPLLDGFGGVGLFGVLAGTGRSVIGVESNPFASHDASHNYGPHAVAVNARFEQWEPQPVGVAVVDPARSGLKARGCDRLVATGADTIALVSCDPAALARDASLLIERGYELDRVTVVDLFGQTSHVETVSRFIKGTGS